MVLIGMLLAGLFAHSESNYAQESGVIVTASQELDFDTVALGTLPAGWKIEATNPKGNLAEWNVIEDLRDSSRGRILSISKIHDESGSVFNLCWTPDVRFQDGELEVMVRADFGLEDQGGGLIWRVRDRNNYYIARYNPLESNFRVYYVKNGSREQLAEGKNIKLSTGEWFTLGIVQRGNKIQGFLNDLKRFEVTDSTFPDAGGVGFWTKADAASSFDDFRCITE